jgi:hypothetical protein
MPEKVAAVSGMRGMFRCIGGVLGTAMVTLILSQFSDHAIGMQYIYTGFGILLLFLIPVFLLSPILLIKNMRMLLVNDRLLRRRRYR